MPLQFTPAQLDDHYRRFYENAWSDSSPDSSPARGPIASPVADVVLSLVPKVVARRTGTESAVFGIPSSDKSGAESVVSNIPSSGKSDADSAVSVIPSSVKSVADSAVSVIPISGKSVAESAVLGIPSSGKSGTESAASAIPSSGNSSAESAVAGIPSSGKSGTESAASDIPSSGKSGTESVASGIPCSGKSGAETALSDIPSTGKSGVDSAVSGIATPIPSSSSVSKCVEEMEDYGYLGFKKSLCYMNELRLDQMTEKERETHELFKKCLYARRWYYSAIKTMEDVFKPSEMPYWKPVPPRKQIRRIGINDIRSNEYKDRYNLEVKKSDGFYVNDRPGRRVYGEIYPVNLRDEENIVDCEKLAIIAIRAYNKKNTRALQLVKLKMATFQNACGPLYYLTFIAKYRRAMNPAEKCGKTYQAKVFCGSKVVTFRVHPEKGKPDPKENLWLDDDSDDLDDSEEEKVVKRKRQKRNGNKNQKLQKT